MPLVSPTTTTTTSSETIDGPKRSGRKRQNPVANLEEEPNKKRQRIDERKEKKLTIRKKLLKQFLREIELYSNKAGEPWYDFASLYASAMGGLVKTEDLIACYPYDFYTPTLWEKRNLNKMERNVPSSKGENVPVIDINEEEEEEEEEEKKRNRSEKGGEEEEEESLDASKRENKVHAVRVLAQHIKDLVGKYLRHHTAESSLDAILKEAAAAIIKKLYVREVKQEQREQGQQIPVNVEDAEEEEEEKRQIREMQLSKLPPSSTPHSTSTQKIAALKQLVKKETEKVARMTSVSKRGITLDVDIDDDVLYPSASGERDDDDNDEYLDEISKTMGMNIFNPEFKALITMCADDINGLSDTSNRNFTPYELCMSPIVRTQFAKFMALCTSPVNNKFSTKTPFSTQSYTSNFNNNNNGNTIIVQPAQTRYVMAANKVEIQAAYEFFKRVKRSREGTLVLQNKSSRELQVNVRRDVYGRRIPDEYEETENYGYGYVNENNMVSYRKPRNGNNVPGYYSGTERFSSHKINVDFIL
jgi:hypothetical protein